MDEVYSGGPDAGYQPYPDGSRQADDWPNEDWFRPQRGQARLPDPNDVAGDRGRGRHRHGDRRRPDPDQTEDLNLRVPQASRSWNWALIAGTVFFLIDTLLMADGFARPVGTGSRVLVIFIWLIGLAAVALLWLRASFRFFKPGSSYPGGDQGSPGPL